MQPSQSTTLDQKSMTIIKTPYNSLTNGTWCWCRPKISQFEKSNASHWLKCLWLKNPILLTQSQCCVKPFSQWQHSFHLKAVLPLVKRFDTAVWHVGTPIPCPRQNNLLGLTAGCSLISFTLTENSVWWTDRTIIPKPWWQHIKCFSYPPATTGFPSQRASYADLWLLSFC